MLRPAWGQLQGAHQARRRQPRVLYPWGVGPTSATSGRPPESRIRATTPTTGAIGTSSPSTATARRGGCAAAPVPIGAWLKKDLAANEGKACTLAYFHHPLFSSGKIVPAPRGEADLEGALLRRRGRGDNAHDHNYQRFAPQDPEGRADPDRGIREFVVGTGGARATTDLGPDRQHRGPQRRHLRRPEARRYARTATVAVRARGGRDFHGLRKRRMPLAGTDNKR